MFVCIGGVPDTIEEEPQEEEQHEEETMHVEEEVTANETEEGMLHLVL